VLLAQRRYEEAETQARAALSVFPDAARAHRDLWAALEAQNKWSELERAARETLRTRPEHAEAQARLHRALAQQARVVSGRPRAR
jgi:hypothetical protein